MKKALFALINFIALILCFDIKNIFELYQFSDGAGIGIYILGGIVELNDKVPYKNVPFYMAVLSAAVVAVIIADIYIMYRNKSRHN